MHKNEVAGSLKFNTLCNFNPIFKELQGEYTKKTPEQKVAEKKPSETKPEEKKPIEPKAEEKKANEATPVQIKP